METPIDPLRVPTINLNTEEIAEIIAKMKTGELPPDYLDRYYDALDANVFGVDAKKDRDGFRMEQGIGSPAQPSANSVAAYKKFGKDEPEYEKNLGRMERELAAYLEKRKAQAVKTGRRMHAGRA
jgi:hypothetical protein